MFQQILQMTIFVILILLVSQLKSEELGAKKGKILLLYDESLFNKIKSRL
jgi:hypothetical protein